MTALIISLIIGGSIFTFMLSAVGLDAIGSIFKRLTLTQWLLVVTTFYIHLICTTLGLHTIIHSFGSSVSRSKLFGYQCIKYAFGYITPLMNVGGEPAQAYLLNKQEQIPLDMATSSIILERVLRLTLAVIIFAVGLVVAFSRLVLTNETKVMLIIVLLFFIIFMSAFYRAMISRKGFFNRIITVSRLYRFVSQHKRLQVLINRVDTMTVHFFHQDKKHFLLALFFSFCSLITIFLQSYMVLFFLGYHARVTDLLLIFTVQNLLMLIPIPAALGVYEAGNAALFALQEIGLHVGVAFTLVLRIANVIVISPGLLLASYYGLHWRSYIKEPLIITADNNDEHI